MKRVCMVAAVVVVVLINLSEGFQPRRILFARCSSEEPVPRAVFMTCANRRGVCDVRLGQSHNLRAIFIAQYNSSNVDSYVRWNSWMEVPLPEQQRDACDGEIACPVEEGQITQFTYSLHIQNYWPRKEFPVIWSLTARETDDPLLCFRFKINII